MVTDGDLSGRFDLLGHTEDIAGFLRGLDLYVNTSRHEGIPMSVLEAMACGLPVVAPRVGGLSEIVEHGRQGFLIEGSSPEKFAEACLRILGDRGFTVICPLRPGCAWRRSFRPIRWRNTIGGCIVSLPPTGSAVHTERDLEALDASYPQENH